MTSARVVLIRVGNLGAVLKSAEVRRGFERVEDLIIKETKRFKSVFFFSNSMKSHKLVSEVFRI